MPSLSTDMQVIPNFKKIAEIPRAWLPASRLARRNLQTPTTVS